MKDGEVNVEWGNDKGMKGGRKWKKYRGEKGKKKENNAEGNLVLNEFVGKR